MTAFALPLPLLFALWVAVVPPVSLQGAPLRVAIDQSGGDHRPVVTLGPVLDDPTLREAVASGLPLRLRVRTELWKKGFFDRLVSRREFNLAVLQDPLDRSFIIEDGLRERRVASAAAAHAELQAKMDFDLRASARGRFYYLSTLEIETLSLSDLEELRRWLRGEVQPAVAGRQSPGRAVGRGLRRLLVRTLALPTRHYEARSPTFVIR